MPDFDFDPVTQFFFDVDRIAPAWTVGDLTLAQDPSPDNPDAAFVIRQVVPHTDDMGSSLPTLHMSVETRELLCDALLQIGGDGNEVANVGALRSSAEQRATLLSRCEPHAGDGSTIYADVKDLLHDYDKLCYRVVRLRRIAHEQHERAEAEAKAANDYAVRIAKLERELADAKGLRDIPQTAEFARAVALEADHQVARWGVAHDAGKSSADWFWLLGYLAGKALHAAIGGDIDKALHHTISSAAALLNWHRALSGQPTTMRPGIAPPDDLLVEPQSVHENLSVLGIMIDGVEVAAPYPIPGTYFDGSATLRVPLHGGYAERSQMSAQISVRQCLRVGLLSCHPRPLLVNLQIHTDENVTYGGTTNATFGHVLDPGAECTLTLEVGEPMRGVFQINAIENFEMKAADNDGQEHA